MEAIRFSGAAFLLHIHRPHSHFQDEAGASIPALLFSSGTVLDAPPGFPAPLGHELNQPGQDRRKHRSKVCKLR